MQGVATHLRSRCPTNGARRLTTRAKVLRCEPQRTPRAHVEEDGTTRPQSTRSMGSERLPDPR
eukprot:6714276-Prymnesium_polylepis.2